MVANSPNSEESINIELNEIKRAFLLDSSLAFFCRNKWCTALWDKETFMLMKLFSLLEKCDLTWFSGIIQNIIFCPYPFLHQYATGRTSSDF